MIVDNPDVKEYNQDSQSVDDLSIEDDKSYTDDTVAKNRAEKRREQLIKNVKQGRAFEVLKFCELQKIAVECVEQITIVTAKNTRIRVDAMAIDPQNPNNIIIQEYKSSKTAPLSYNQEKGFEELKEYGGVIVGKGKGEVFIGGKEIPKGTKVKIIRPE